MTASTTTSADTTAATAAPDRTVPTGDAPEDSAPEGGAPEGSELDPVAELEQAPDTDLVGDDTFVREPADTSDAGDVARAEASDIFDPEEQ